MHAFSQTLDCAKVADRSIWCLTIHGITSDLLILLILSGRQKSNKFEEFLAKENFEPYLVVTRYNNNLFACRGVGAMEIVAMDMKVGSEMKL